MYVRSTTRTKPGKIKSNDYWEKSNFKNRLTRFRNSEMLHLRMLYCHQGWHVYQRNTKEIKRRIMLGKSAMSKLEKIIKDKNLAKQTKIKIAETLVFPIEIGRASCRERV